MKLKTLLLILSTATIMFSCQTKPQTNPETNTWDSQLAETLPYLGHRNWIVITDMAYPLQSGSGITTLYANEPYIDVLKKVKQMVDEAPHIFAHVYHDKELELLTEELVPGIDSLRTQMNLVCGNDAQGVVHEQLIKRMDEAGSLYNIVIIKTPLTMAYTTTFFELDCAYWNAEKQAALDTAMANQ